MKLLLFITKYASNFLLSVGTGPFGYRSMSEEALPIARTLAYLTDLHPPNLKAETIPVRCGGRPCLCRQNRNDRKTLNYAISGLASGIINDVGIDQSSKIIKSELKQESPPAVIEGVFWQTPEPSIRRSDEYINEYELYDSPYAKRPCEEKTYKIKQKIDAYCNKKRNNGGADCPEGSRNEGWYFLTDCTKFIDVNR